MTPNVQVAQFLVAPHYALIAQVHTIFIMDNAILHAQVVQLKFLLPIIHAFLALVVLSAPFRTGHHNVLLVHRAHICMLESAIRAVLHVWVQIRHRRSANSAQVIVLDAIFLILLVSALYASQDYNYKTTNAKQVALLALPL